MSSERFTFQSLRWFRLWMIYSKYFLSCSWLFSKCLSLIKPLSIKDDTWPAWHLVFVQQKRLQSHPPDENRGILSCVCVFAEWQTDEKTHFPLKIRAWPARSPGYYRPPGVAVKWWMNFDFCYSACLNPERCRQTHVSPGRVISHATHPTTNEEWTWNKPRKLIMRRVLMVNKHRKVQ